MTEPVLRPVEQDLLVAIYRWCHEPYEMILPNGKRGSMPTLERVPNSVLHSQFWKHELTMFDTWITALMAYELIEKGFPVFIDDDNFRAARSWICPQGILKLVPGELFNDGEPITVLRFELDGEPATTLYNYPTPITTCHLVTGSGLKLARKLIDDAAEVAVEGSPRGESDLMYPVTLKELVHVLNQFGHYVGSNDEAAQLCKDNEIPSYSAAEWNKLPNAVQYSRPGQARIYNRRDLMDLTWILKQRPEVDD